MWTAQQAANQKAELQGLFGTGREEADKWLTYGYEKSLPELEQYYGGAKAELAGTLANANRAWTEGRDASLGEVRGGYGAALSDLGRLYGQGADTYRQAAAGYDPLIQRGMSGYDMYMSSLGLNGPEGNAAARGAFQAGPGYEWAVNQATSGAQRAANKLGGAYGGNTTDAVTRLSNNLANQEYGKWQQNLQGFQGAAQNAVSGQAGVLQNLGNLYATQGNQTAQLQANQGKDLATIYQNAAQGISGNEMTMGKYNLDLMNNRGADLASLHTGYGQSMANNALGYMTNLANATNQAYNTVIPAGQSGLMAGQQAAQNRMGAMMGGLQMGGQLLGGFMGLGTGGGNTIGGSLFKSMWG
jgi:hypothetical protein